MMKMMKSAEELSVDPAKYFSSPVEVLINKQLSVEDKQKILAAWRFDAEQLAVATDENMTGGERPNIEAINNALLSLAK